MKFTLLAVALTICASALQAEVLFKTDKDLPADAIVLFKGGDHSSWSTIDGKAIPWKLKSDYMEISGGSIRTKEVFDDVQLHLEFWLPLMKDQQGQGRANSGVYLQGMYEVQILDSYGLEPESHNCGGIYGVAPPLVNASRPPQTWQTYDIIFHKAKVSPSGELQDPARMTVIHNGVLIHNNVAVPGITPGGMGGNPKDSGPLMLQDHGNPIRFRNIWIRKL